MKVNARHQTSPNFIIRSYNYTRQRRNYTSLDLATIKIHIIHWLMIQMQIICPTSLLQQVQKHSSIDIVSINRSARKSSLSVFCNQPRNIGSSTINWHCAYDPLVFDELQRSRIEIYHNGNNKQWKTMKICYCGCFRMARSKYCLRDWFHVLSSMRTHSTQWSLMCILWSNHCEKWWK